MEYLHVGNSQGKCLIHICKIMFELISSEKSEKLHVSRAENGFNNLTTHFGIHLTSKLLKQFDYSLQKISCLFLILSCYYHRFVLPVV